MYMITDGKQFLTRNKKGAFVLCGKNIAIAYESEQKAQNVLKSCLAKPLQAKCYITKVDPVTNDAQTLDVEEEKNISVSDYSSNICEEYAKAVEEWKQKLLSLQKFADTVEQECEKLKAELSDVDKEISDINHYIEFSRLNAYQGYVAYQMLKIRFELRRKIKNKINIIKMVGDSKINSDSLVDVLKKIGGIDNQHYTPRKLDALFDSRRIHFNS